MIKPSAHLIIIWSDQFFTICLSPLSRKISTAPDNLPVQSLPRAPDALKRQAIGSPLSFMGWARPLTPGRQWLHPGGWPAWLRSPGPAAPDRGLGSDRD